MNLTPWPPLRTRTSPPAPLHQVERGVLLLALLLSACVVDSSVPRDAQLTCAVDEDCPGGWTCVDDLCRPEGWTPDVAEADEAGEDVTDDGTSDTALSRLEDRLTICTALYDKIKACPAEVKATLGQEIWDLVGDDRDAFAETTCARDLLGDATDKDLNDYLAQVALVGSITCPLFVSVLCDLFPADAGYTTSCP